MQPNEVQNIVLTVIVSLIALFITIVLPLLVIANGYSFIRYKRTFQLSDLEPLKQWASPHLKQFGVELGETALNTPATIGKILLIGLAVILFPITLPLALYFLPSILGRKKKNFGAIFALNLFLGFTVIGWIIALVWGLTKD